MNNTQMVCLPSHFAQQKGHWLDWIKWGIFGQFIIYFL